MPFFLFDRLSYSIFAISWFCRRRILRFVSPLLWYFPLPCFHLSSSGVLIILFSQCFFRSFSLLALWSFPFFTRFCFVIRSTFFFSLFLSGFFSTLLCLSPH